MIPSVQANAAKTLARAPRERPAARVNRTPVPGDATTISDVNKNSVLITKSPKGCVSSALRSVGGAAKMVKPTSVPRQWRRF
jgi:hypothetical protein